MKKRITFTLVITLGTAILLAGCSSSTYGKYLTLGDYKGLSVSKIKTEITDDTLNEEMEYVLDDSTEYNEVDRAAQDGDMVTIDYHATIDGEEFDGGDMENMEFEIGQGYLDGDLLANAESEFIGMKAGDTKDLEITIPDDYYFDESLAGKPMALSITMKTVSEVVRPELTDEFIASISEFSTVEEYKADLRQSLEASYEENSAYTAGSDAIQQVIDNSTFKGYPDELYTKCKELYDQTNEMYAEMLGLDVSDFSAGDEDVKDAVESMVYEEMVITAIAEKEKISVSDDEYSEFLDANLEAYGMTSAEEFESTYSKESIMDEILRTKVQNFLLDNATVTEVNEEEYYGEYEEDGLVDENVPDDELVDEVLNDSEENLDTEAE